MVPCLFTKKLEFDFFLESGQEDTGIVDEVRIINGSKGRIVTFVMIWRAEAFPLIDPSRGDEIPSVAFFLGGVLELAWSFYEHTESSVIDESRPMVSYLSRVDTDCTRGISGGVGRGKALASLGACSCSSSWAVGWDRLESGVAALSDSI